MYSFKLTMHILSILIMFLVTICPVSARPITTTNVIQANQPPAIDQISNQTIEAGDRRSLSITARDPDGNAGLKLTIITPPSYASLTDGGNGNGTLFLNPSCQETQSSQITIRVTDPMGLSAETSFTVVVIDNLPPKFLVVPDITISAGSSMSFKVVEETGGNPTRLSIVDPPSFISLSDNGDDTGAIFIRPSLTDTQGGRVTIQAVDSCGATSSINFNITINRMVVLTAASFDEKGKQLFISGVGFGTSGARVTINGQDVSARIIGQSDTSITLKGGRKKLNLKRANNQIVVTSGGVGSNTFVLNLFSGE